MTAETQVQNGNGATDTATKASDAAVTFTTMKTQLVVEAPKAAEAVAFYKAAFGAEEVNRVMHSKRKADQEIPLVLSAQLELASTLFEVSDFSDDTPLEKKEGAIAGIVFTLETENIEGAVAKAISAGGVAEGEIAEVEGGGRVAKLKDPYGYVWIISSPAKVTAPTTGDAQA